MAYKDKAQTISYNNAFNREKYDRITIMLEKGCKAELQAAAQLTGESVNSYVKRAISERMERGKQTHT